VETALPRPSVLSPRVWLLAARPATLTAAVAPVLVGTAAAARDHDFRPLAFAAALAAAVLIQVGTNLANDVADFERGADAGGRLGPPRVTQQGLLAAPQVRWAAYASFAAAAGLGLYLVLLAGWPVLALGLLSIAAGLTYTAGPWPFGYHGLGDIFVFLFFGLGAVGGSYFVQTESFDRVALLAALPVALTVTAILVVNNLRDRESDARAGKRTLAVIIGERATRLQYACCVLGAYVLVAALAGAGELPRTALLGLVSLPFALALVTSVLRGAAGPHLNDVLKGTARLHLLLGATFALGFLL
jgi:1,4-dihydroxy-2-naphthoate octaprenyltransferase